MFRILVLFGLLPYVSFASAADAVDPAVGKTFWVNGYSETSIPLHFEQHTEKGILLGQTIAAGHSFVVAELLPGASPNGSPEYREYRVVTDDSRELYIDKFTFDGALFVAKDYVLQSADYLRVRQRIFSAPPERILAAINKEEGLAAKRTAADAAH